VTKNERNSESQIMEYQKAGNLASELSSKLGRKVLVMCYPDDLGMNGGVMGYHVDTAAKLRDKFRFQKELLWFINDNKVHVYYQEDIEIARKFAKILEEHFQKEIEIIKHYSSV
jgi:hypothetical protein